MRDAYGGIVNLAILVVFLVLVNGYLAFNVNYTKAFRVKNKIITTLENYSTTSGTGCDQSGTCQNIISDYEKKIGYSVTTITDNSGNKNTVCPPSLGFCYTKIFVGSSADGSTEEETTTNVIDDNRKYYYKVITAVNINIPLINKILPSIFTVSGNTNIIDPELDK